MEYLNNDVRWRIVHAAVDRTTLVRDDRFLALLTLARALNAVRYFQVAYVTIRAGDQSPSATRQRVNAFFFLSAAIREALHVVERLRKSFYGRDYFENGLGEILRDPNVQRLRNSVLTRIRNKFAFHFDDDVAVETLPTLDIPDLVFVAGRGSSSGNVYYELADTVALNYLLNAITEEGVSEAESMENALRETSTLSVRLLDAGEQLIATVLQEMGWRLEERSNSV